MLCQFERLIYPRPSSEQRDSSGYMIAIYRPCEKMKDAAGNVIRQIKAVGYSFCLTSTYEKKNFKTDISL